MTPLPVSGVHGERIHKISAFWLDRRDRFDR